MKRLIYLLPVLVALTGCLNDRASQPIPAPSGTFSGEFRRISKSNTKPTFDTLKANIKLILEPGVGYHVLGDTATVHAGSKGTYGIGNIIRFIDNTYPKTGTPTKNHLNGDYLFFYNGYVFQILRNSGDTLSLQYELKKTN